MTDRTPDGREIVTGTIWLNFDDGQVALSWDATEFKYQLKRCSEAFKRTTTSTGPNPDPQESSPPPPWT